MFAAGIVPSLQYDSVMRWAANGDNNILEAANRRI